MNPEKILRDPLLVARGASSRLRLIGLGLICVLTCLWTEIEFLYHKADRLRAVKEARIHSRFTSRPVLNYGCGETNYGDVNADIVPRNLPNFVLIKPSPASTPFRDAFFAAAICSNVLEHVADPYSLLRELKRISDKVCLSNPNPLFVWSWLYPEHLWIFIRSRPYRIRREAPNLEEKRR